MAMLTIDIEEAAEAFESIASAVYHDGDDVLVTRKDKPWVVISAATDEVIAKLGE
jgi:PHD/YefM family antitoxin component YafN of YafNO toxin-antitoxin module